MCTFMEYRDSRALFQDITFEGNHAPIGGAIYARQYVQAIDVGRPRHGFSGNLAEPTITMVNVTFLRNNATEGGSLYFDGILALLEKVIMQENNATESGGAVKIVSDCVLQITDGFFLSNSAESGGSLMIGEQSILHCITCSMENNMAERNGGSVCVTTQLYTDQPIAFQCDACNFTNNTALMGGTSGLQCSPFGEFYHRWASCWISDRCRR